MLKKIMSYLYEYSYGHVGEMAARKFLLTGRVDVYHVNEWIKATRKASAKYKEQEAVDIPLPSSVPAEATPRARKVNRVNAAQMDAETPAVQPGAPAPLPVIDVAAVRRRQEDDLQRQMAELASKPPVLAPQPPLDGGSTAVPPAEDFRDAPSLPIDGDPEAFCQKVESISQELDKIQYSSASGYRDLQELRRMLREAIAEYRQEEPPLDIPE